MARIIKKAGFRFWALRKRKQIVSPGRIGSSFFVSYGVGGVRPYKFSVLLVATGLGYFCLMGSSAEAVFMTGGNPELEIKKQQMEEQKASYQDKIGLAEVAPSERELLERVPVSLEIEQARKEMLQERRQIMEVVNKQKKELEEKRKQEITRVQEEILMVSNSVPKTISSVKESNRLLIIQIGILLFSLCLVFPFFNKSSRLQKFLNE